MDYIFSYWIFVWFVLYLLGIIQTAPVLLIYLGILVNLFELLYFVYLRIPLYQLVKFCLINTALKIIPLYFVWNKPITEYEIKATIVVLLAYVLWLYINKVDIYSVYNHFIKTYKTGYGDKTLLSEYYDIFYKKLR
jgi:hypothetical protein